MLIIWIILIFKKENFHSFMITERRTLKIIEFSNSTSLITAIMSKRKMFAASINESVNSEVFIKFVEKLKDLLELKMRLLLIIALLY